MTPLPGLNQKDAEMEERGVMSSSFRGSAVPATSVAVQRDDEFLWLTFNAGPWVERISVPIDYERAATLVVMLDDFISQDIAPPASDPQSAVDLGGVE